MGPPRTQIDYTVTFDGEFVYHSFNRTLSVTTSEAGGDIDEAATADDNCSIYTTNSRARLLPSNGKGWKSKGNRLRGRNVHEIMESGSLESISYGPGCYCCQQCQRGLALLRKVKEKMKRPLHYIQIIIGILIVVFSALVFFPLSRITQDFGGEYCLLYAKIYVMWNDNMTVSLDRQRSVFENESECNYTTYINVCMAIVSAMFIWFSYHNKATKDGKTDDVMLQVAMLLFHIVFFCCIFVSSVHISKGFQEWCTFIKDNNLYNQKKFDCSKYEEFSWTTDMTLFYTYTLFAEACSWLLLIFVTLQCFITTLSLVKSIKSDLNSKEVATEDTKDKHSAIEKGGFTNQGAESSPSSSFNHLATVSEEKEEVVTDSLVELDSSAVNEHIAEIQVHRADSKDESSKVRNSITGAYSDKAKLIDED